MINNGRHFNTFENTWRTIIDKKTFLKSISFRLAGWGNHSICVHSAEVSICCNVLIYLTEVFFFFGGALQSLCHPGVVTTASPASLKTVISELAIVNPTTLSRMISMVSQVLSFRKYLTDYSYRSI